MIDWEPIPGRSSSGRDAALADEITLTIFRIRKDARPSARISFPDASAHPFFGPFEAPQAVGVCRSVDGRHFLIDATRPGPFRVVRLGRSRTLCVTFPWLWDEPTAPLVLVADAVGAGLVEYHVRDAESAALGRAPAVPAPSSHPSAEEINRALAPVLRRQDAAFPPHPSAAVTETAPLAPVAASRDAVAAWASQRGLPHSPFVLSQVNQKRRALGLAPFALPERARR